VRSYFFAKNFFNKEYWLLTDPA